MIIASYGILIADCNKCGKDFFDLLQDEITDLQELKMALNNFGWKIDGKVCMCDVCKNEQ